MPLQLQYSPQTRERLDTAWNNIVYIADQAYLLVQDGLLPISAIWGYARRYTIALNVNETMRDFVATQAHRLVENWLTNGRTAQ